MAVDEENPYASPACQETPEGASYVSRHEWCGRVITVEGALLASRLWMLIGYAITIDGRERLETAQMRMHEDFHWQFVHQGRKVTGHFRTLGHNSIVRRYELSLDGESLGTFQVRLRAWWMQFVICVLGGVFAASAAIACGALQR